MNDNWKEGWRAFKNGFLGEFKNWREVVRIYFLPVIFLWRQSIRGLRFVASKLRLASQ
jgi:hypothetical protein